MVRRVPVLDHAPRGGARGGGAQARRRHRARRRPGHAQSAPAHPQGADRDGGGPARLVLLRRLDVRLGERALRCALGAPLPEAFGPDGDRGTGGKPAAGRAGGSGTADRARARRVRPFDWSTVRGGRRRRARRSGHRALGPLHSQPRPVRVQPAAAPADGRQRRDPALHERRRRALAAELLPPADDGLGGTPDRLALVRAALQADLSLRGGVARSEPRTLRDPCPADRTCRRWRSSRRRRTAPCR